MPEIPYVRQPIRYPVAARLLGGVELPQHATLTGFRVDITPDTHELSAVLLFRVAFVDEAGEPLETGRGVSPYPVELRADNNAMVDVRTGAVRYLRRPGANETWDELLPDGTRVELVGGLDAAPEPLLGQGDALREELKRPQDLLQLFADHLHAANGPMYNKFR